MATEMMRYSPMNPASVIEAAEEVFGQAFGRPARQLAWSGAEGNLPLDISETADALIVRASLAGYTADEIDVQLHQGVLTIKAQRQDDEAAGAERYHRRERASGPLSRRVALPGLVHEAEVDAQFENGLLTLTVPFPAQAKPRQIQVKAQ